MPVQPQVEGALVVKAIEAVVRQQDKPLPIMVTGHLSKNVSAETSGAKSAIDEHYIASTSSDKDGGIKSLAGHERCQVVLHLDVETLKQAHSCEHHAAHDCTCQHHGPLNTSPNLDLYGQIQKLTAYALQPTI